jgi:hypothetical protein
VKKQPKEVEVEVLPKDGGPTPDPRSVSRNDDPFVALMARLMDSAFVIPGTNIRFGLDPILGLLPGLGDTLTAAVSIGLILQSARYGVPKVVLARMAMNVLANTAVGSIPVVGDAFSVYYKSNVKNYELLRRHAGTQRKATTSDWIFVIGVIAAIITLLVLILVGIATLLSLLGDWVRSPH